VILTAEGKAFCAGADLKERKGMSDDEVASTVRGLGALATRLAELPMPTLAGLGGAALGGGLELALACDMRIAARGIKLGLPETSLAIVPGAGGTQRLARVVGPARAKRWILTARVAPSEIAHEEGLIDALVEPEQLESALLERAAEIARCGPVALRAAKQAIDRGFGAATMREALDEEWAAYQRVLPTRDRREALEAFAEKRPPRFEGR
jgi:enoyl-CoA hydratase/carnithine racemase